MWKLSSAGRASALQAEGHRFEPYSFHHMREWLSGRASPCQGECRESESRLPLHKMLIWHLGQVVRQSSAKALFSSPNLEGASKTSKKMTCVCRVGGIGRREGLKIPWSKGCAGSSPAPGTKRDEKSSLFSLFSTCWFRYFVLKTHALLFIIIISKRGVYAKISRIPIQTIHDN